ncbi:MAG TPA: sterol desaturase family protein [Casimicrobiaceae bacterium]|jgi:sterol desaturase/sphingolipid hydroxylase (fatty acid hydroxylase superfamily)|nr:sterol desaturase family protein [Casimicrobiaceae bacterium]
MNAIDILGLLVPVTYFAMLGIERRWPARVFPTRRGWQWLGIAFLILVGLVSAITPLLVPVEWLAAHAWLPGGRLGVAGGALVGFVVAEGAVYAYHRAAHTWSFLWRLGHQVHHSPERVDIPGAVLFHPVEIIIQTLVLLFVTVIVLGLDPLAAAIVGYLVPFYGMFQHWNIRTPQWLGWLIQRPEAHCVHHRKGLHYYNFSDLPWWDMLFGTYRNPREFHGECGFEGDAPRRMGAMLAFADVNAPFYGEGSRGQKVPVSAS